MRVTFVRHTRTVAPEGVCYGRTDLALSDEGLRHAGHIVEHWDVPPVDYVLSSPAQRCRHLAEALGVRLSVPIQYDERLWELDFGDWEMRSWQEIPPQELNPWMENYVEAVAGGAESFLQLVARSRSALAEHRDRGAAHIACVAHSGVIRGLLAIYENQPLNRAFRRACDYGSIHSMIVPSGL